MKTFTKNFVVTSLYTIDNRGRTFRLLCIIQTSLLTDQGPEFIKIDSRAMIFIHGLMVVEHTNFSKVTGMVFVEPRSVMMLTTCVTTTTGMFSVFSNTTMSCAFVSPLLAVLT